MPFTPTCFDRRNVPPQPPAKSRQSAWLSWAVRFLVRDPDVMRWNGINHRLFLSEAPNSPMKRGALGGKLAGWHTGCLTGNEAWGCVATSTACPRRRRNGNGRMPHDTGCHQFSGNVFARGCSRGLNDSLTCGDAAELRAGQQALNRLRAKSSCLWHGGRSSAL